MYVAICEGTIVSFASYLEACNYVRVQANKTKWKIRRANKTDNVKPLDNGALHPFKFIGY